MLSYRYCRQYVHHTTLPSTVQYINAWFPLLLLFLSFSSSLFLFSPHLLFLSKNNTFSQFLYAQDKAGTSHPPSNSSRLSNLAPNQPHPGRHTSISQTFFPLHLQHRTAGPWLPEIPPSLPFPFQLLFIAHPLPSSGRLEPVFRSHPASASWSIFAIHPRGPPPGQLKATFGACPKNKTPFIYSPSSCSSTLSFGATAYLVFSRLVQSLLSLSVSFIRHVSSPDSFFSLLLFYSSSSTRHLPLLKTTTTASTKSPRCLPLLARHPSNVGTLYSRRPKLPVHHPQLSTPPIACPYALKSLRSSILRRAQSPRTSTCASAISTCLT